MQGNEPFFTNDLEGWAKVVGFFIAIVAFVGGVMSKLISNTFSTRLESVERELAVTIERRGAVDNQLDGNARDLLLLGADVKGLHESYGRTEEQFKELSVKVDRQRDSQIQRDERIAVQLGGLEAKMDILLKRSGATEAK